MKEFSHSAKKGIGFELEDLELINATSYQIKRVREVLDDVIKSRESEKITFDSWRVWIMIFPSGLLVPMLKEVDK